MASGLPDSTHDVLVTGDRTAQNESRPELVTISRTINNTGAIDNETNERGYMTVFGRDNLNELTSVQTAKATDDNFSIS